MPYDLVLKVKGSLVIIQNWFVVTIISICFKRSHKDDALVRIGSTYGGWWVPEWILMDSSRARSAVSVGLGFDVSFDERLLEAGFYVLGMDPLLDSIRSTNHDLAKYGNRDTINAGLWVHSGQAIFYRPKIDSHDSWSIVNSQQTSVSDAESFPTLNMKEIQKKYPKVDANDYLILKMDIEGAELDILEGLCEQSFKCNLLAVEIDSLSLISFLSIFKRIKTVIRTLSLCSQLKSLDYRLAKTEGYNFHWSGNLSK